MSRTAILVIGFLVAAAAGLVLLAYPAKEGAELPGYMEADLVLVGSEKGGRIETLDVQEGDHVKTGDPVFTLESSEQEAAVAAAKARVAEADARLADARAELQRPREIEVLKSALARAQAMLKQSSLNLERVQSLYDKGWVSKAQLDDAIAQHDSNDAAVAEAKRRIDAAKLPGRSGVIEAASAAVTEAKHALDEAEKNLAKRQVFAPTDGTIEEVYFRPGEVVNAGQGVVALLPPGNLKVRFFVDEPDRAKLQVGQTVDVSCDGCPPGLTAKINFIARDAEFTPPVIFSEEQRKKLVYLVEARPQKDTAKLTAGQPVTVSFASGDEKVVQR
jgi:HlyD family secretion protein